MPAARNAIDRSLAAVDGDGNGSADHLRLRGERRRVRSARLTSLPPVRSPWQISRDAVARRSRRRSRADWCVATPTGAACGVDAQGVLSTDGVPWSFAFAGANSIRHPRAQLSVHSPTSIATPRRSLHRCATAHRVRAQPGPRLRPGDATSQRFPRPAPVALWMGDSRW